MIAPHSDYILENYACIILCWQNEIRVYYDNTGYSVYNLCDLGINDLHCYGRNEHHTPHLDRFASQGIRFTSAYASQPICFASRAGLMTGLNPERLHLTTYLHGRPNKNEIHCFINDARL